MVVYLEDWLSTHRKAKKNAISSAMQYQLLMEMPLFRDLDSQKKTAIEDKLKQLDDSTVLHYKDK